MTIHIREAIDSDAAALLELRLVLDRETLFMLLEADERSRSVEAYSARLATMLAAENSTVIVACEEESIVGFLQARGGTFRRNRHVVDIVVGIRQSHTGQGIGKKLFAALDEWAALHDVARLELTVMPHNEAAIALYERAGFRTEARKVGSLRVDGQPVDELLMAKLLTSS